MSVLRRLLCLAGRHSGQWSHPGSRCETVRTCDVCGRAGERIRHTWSPYGYVGAEQCDQTRRCRRCGTTASRTVHDWGPWLYVNKELNSPQVRSCRRCHDTERILYTLR